MPVFLSFLKRKAVIIPTIIAMVILSYYLFVLRDPWASEVIDIDIYPPENPELKIGFSAVKITPDIPDTQIDRNGKSSPVWLAGFGRNRAAQGIMDDLWARTMVIDDGKTRIAFTVIDAIGIFMHDVMDTREMLPNDYNVDYLAIHATHVHSAPDLMGLWGPKIYKSGINPDYMKFVKEQIVASVGIAVKELRPAKLKFLYTVFDEIIPVEDSRKPYNPDVNIFALQAIDKENGNSLGSLIQWSCHPETMWNDNKMITSDFPHYVREGMETGFYVGDSLHKTSIGGISLYANGALGGLMTARPSFGIGYPPPLFTDTLFYEPSVFKIKAQGYIVAERVQSEFNRLGKIVENVGIRLKVKTIYLPIENPIFRKAALIGLLRGGMSGWMKKRSEIAGWCIGPASFATLPGEMYPEMVNGVAVALNGNDFNLLKPVEDKALRAFMTGDYRFVFGTSNDQIGYVIPKSQWDMEPPFSFDSSKQYGEENSLGPETGPILYNEFKTLWKDILDTENKRTTIESLRNLWQEISESGHSKEVYNIFTDKYLSMLNLNKDSASLENPEILFKAIAESDNWKVLHNQFFILWGNILKSKEQE